MACSRRRSGRGVEGVPKYVRFEADLQRTQNANPFLGGNP